MKSLKIAIIGGSLGGLFTGIALKEKGHKVDIYERSSGTMEDRGAGLVVQPDIEAFLLEHQLATLQDVTVPLTYRKFLRRDGNFDEISMPQLMTSWSRLYNTLIEAFPSENFHSGKKAVDFTQSNNEVSVDFQDGIKVTADYVIGADGIGSVVRKEVLPAVSPIYAGYIAWRGTVNIEEIPRDMLDFFLDKFTFYQGINTQILSYFIPNKYSHDSIRLNWVWYETILDTDQLNQLMTANNGRKYNFVMPPNQLPESVIYNQKQKAKRILPTNFSGLVNRTKTPFVHPIYDLDVSQMVFNNIILLGDASFVPRPHTGSGVSKAAYNAMKLATAFDLEKQPIEQLGKRLKEWEIDQLRLGQHLSRLGKQLGNRSKLGYEVLI